MEERYVFLLAYLNQQYICNGIKDSQAAEVARCRLTTITLTSHSPCVGIVGVPRTKSHQSGYQKRHQLFI